ncbi:MAG: N-acetyltransferase [Candidatus Omnitrophica bacterium]|nr:N-acetyltransferase [Candidatus Omnitrophota bacterium]
MKRLKNTQVGKNCRIDKTAILGCKTGRKIKSAKTAIGDNAVIRSNTVIYSNSRIGAGLQTGHNVVIREQNRIGNGFNIWNNSTVDYGCTIGNNVKVHNNVYISQYTTIEDNVFLAPGVMIANDPHPLCARCMRGPLIKKGARIGINATLLPKIVVGENSLVAAGSVVTKDVPRDTVVAGVPAKVIAKVKDLKCKEKIKERAYE